MMLIQQEEKGREGTSYHLTLPMIYSLSFFQALHDILMRFKSFEQIIASASTKITHKPWTVGRGGDDPRGGMNGGNGANGE